ncbi:class I SAM-dependent methyltransferase [Patescibacteria group bacterium]|nr:class I SAM-dependent methyltransferase [Patescibacteria group bacterium]
MQYRFTADWFSNQIPIWEEHLSDLRGKPSIRFLEIGSFEGRSTCWLLDNILTHPDSIITCIDTFSELKKEQLEKHGEFWGINPPYPHNINVEEIFDYNIQATGSPQKVNKLKGKSQRLLRNLPFEHFNGVYIDGSHLAADVLSDAILAWPLLKEDGILLFDDWGLDMYRDPKNNPRTAIESFMKVFEGSFEALHKGWQVIIRKTSERPVAELADIAFGLSASS